MEGLLERINNVTLTKTEKEIAHFFLNSKENVFLMTAKEIAAGLEVSDTSILRFIKHIGFRNFKEFKEYGRSNLQNKVSSLPQFVENLEKLQENSVAESLLQQMQQNISILFEEESLETLEEIADILHQAPKKYIVGLKSAVGFASFFGIRLAYMLRNVYTYYLNDTVLLNSLHNMEEGDVLFLFDYPSYSKEVLFLCKMAKKKKAKILLISNALHSPCASYADLHYVIRIKGISTFHSMIPTQILVEYLLSSISKKLSPEEKEYFIEWKRFLEKR